MAWSVTIAGRTYTQENVEGNAYADEDNGLPAILRSMAESSALISGIYATSSTGHFVETGNTTLTTHQDASSIFLPVGTMVRVASASDLTVYLIGVVTSFVGHSLQLDVTIASQGGYANDWVVGHPSTVVRSLLLDPAPSLNADLDARNFAILNASNLESYAVTLGSAYALSQ
ncbi:hypothetical protein [Thalassobaculum salexigens]|uniref:hypothetical protein n=1 Tax=Thalassobaculum salexigens TaxID=455360 RepID=UPI00048BDEE8|nr:hypothetical protein [Thalassobaculum salexigens]